mmetsp:Transcript_37421/g.91712  ORF Transcript_37421/g.91712 Transcript_37421/m.91712 type:complete len:302 (-) Transcript_37421:39-944(-)
MDPRDVGRRCWPRPLRTSAKPTSSRSRVRNFSPCGSESRSQTFARSLTRHAKLRRVCSSSMRWIRLPAPVDHPLAMPAVQVTESLTRFLLRSMALERGRMFSSLELRTALIFWTLQSCVRGVLTNSCTFHCQTKSLVSKSSRPTSESPPWLPTLIWKRLPTPRMASLEQISLKFASVPASLLFVSLLPRTWRDGRRRPTTLKQWRPRRKSILYQNSPGVTLKSLCDSLVALYLMLIFASTRCLRRSFKRAEALETNSSLTVAVLLPQQVERLQLMMGTMTFIPKCNDSSRFNRENLCSLST